MLYPLSGVQVVEALRCPASRYCTQLLFGLGAQVVSIEPARSRGDGEHPSSCREGSDPAAHLDLGKERRALDLTTPEGSDELDRILGDSDVIVEGTAGHDGAGGLDPRWRAGYEEATRRVAASGSARVVVRISWFGNGGPYAQLRASDLVVTALGGYMSMNGESGREPLKLYGEQLRYQAGLQGAVAVLSGLTSRERDGTASVLDVSVQECAAFLTAGAPQDFFHTGSSRPRAGNSTAASSRGQTYSSILPCRDGYVLVGVLGATDFARLEQLIGRPLAAPEDHLRAFPGAHERELDEICGSWLKERTKQAVAEEAQACGLHWSFVSDVREFVESAQVRARGCVETAHLGNDDSISYLGRPFVLGASGWRKPDR